MCYWYYYYHVPCNHASQVTTAPCDAASATGRSCQLVLQQDEPEKISREEPCPGCADRCPENGYQVGWPDGVLMLYESGDADGS